MRTRFFRLLTIAVLASGMAGIARSDAVHADSITDLGCPTYSALASAVADASGATTLTLECGSATTVAFSSVIPVNGSVTLDASGSGAAITLDGGNSSSLFQVNAGGSLTLNSLTLSHGRASDTGGNVVGGAIANYQGTVVANNVTFNSNAAPSGYGAAIYDDHGTDTITNSTFSNNSVEFGGGAIFDQNGTLTIAGSTFTGNSAHDGGAIDSGGTLTLATSTFAGNSATTQGGAVYNQGNGTIANSTFTGSSAADGGAIANGSRLTVSSSTITGNSATFGAALYNVGALQAGETIISASTGPSCYVDEYGTFTDLGYNLSDDNGVDCAFTAGTDLTSQNPQLTPLAWNGGPTNTMRLQAGSPAIAAIPSASCPATDQRGFFRPGEGKSSCDIGAYEYRTAQSQSIAYTAPDGAASYSYADRSFTVAATGGSSLQPVTFSIAPTSGSVCSAGPSANNQATITINSGGACWVQANQQGAGEYSAAPQVSRLFTIAKIPLTITSQNEAVQYSDPVPALPVSWSGFVRGEGPAALGGSLTCSPGAAVSHGQITSPAGTYTISCSGLSSSDYLFTYVPATLTVTRENASVSPLQANPSAYRVARPGGTSPAITLSARVTEVADGSYGDITRATPATFTLTPIGGPGAAYTCTVPSAHGAVSQVRPATPTAPGSEVVGCTFTGLPVNIYDLTINLTGSSYQGASNSLVTVYDPSLSRVSVGAGQVVNPNTGNTDQFVFSGSYLPTNILSGQFRYSERDGAGHTLWSFTSTTLSSLATMKSATPTGYPKTVKITGVGTLAGAPGYRFVLQGVQAAPTTSDGDEFAVNLYDPSGNLVSSASYSPQALIAGTGNVVIK